jgi:PAS domain S-box-containing protein
VPSLPRLRFDQRLLLLALAAGVPATLLALVLLWTTDVPRGLQGLLTLVVVGTWTGCSFAVRRGIVMPLQTLANLLAALRERDYSVRARTGHEEAATDDPLSAVMREVNELAAALHDQRLGAIEASALLRTVMVEIDVAVFSFDAAGTLRIVNRAGERLLGGTTEQLVGKPAEMLGLAACLDGETPRTTELAFPGATARWEVRRTTFRQEGRPYHLLVLADISRPLRDEERQAWQRLIRVLGHEINNSLAPIKSIAGSLESMLARHSDRAALADVADDMRRGLSVIASRSDALGRFTTAYARLAKLPAPRMAPVHLDDLVRRAAGLETRLPIDIQGGPDVVVSADADQLEQLLINLLRNAVDAALETGGRVRVRWTRQIRSLVVDVDDEGTGISSASNLFVPFFTTKPGGSGIGLVLSRQIAEAHGGTVTLADRPDGPGCRAQLRLPA